MTNLLVFELSYVPTTAHCGGTVGLACSQFLVEICFQMFKHMSSVFILAFSAKIIFLFEIQGYSGINGYQT